MTAAALFALGSLGLVWLGTLWLCLRKRTPETVTVDPNPRLVAVCREQAKLLVRVEHHAEAMARSGNPALRWNGGVLLKLLGRADG